MEPIITLYVGKTMRVEKSFGLVVVRRRRDNQIICDAGVNGNRVFDVQFAYREFQKCNRTRQAAMRALQAAGLK